MIVQAKCVQRAWDSTEARVYVPNEGPLPGGLYELDLSKPSHRKLLNLKTQMQKFVFQFNRAEASDPTSGLYFCPDCGAFSETLNAIGSHMRTEHKKSFVKEPEPEPEPEVEAPPTGLNAAGDVRGIGPRHCKGCGQPFDSVNALVRHKPDCPGKPPEVAVQEVNQTVAEVGPATSA